MPVTLVMAFIGERGAVMAGDMREITFLGSRDATGRLEEELNTGIIATDGELARRAAELGVEIRVRDDKVKVSRRDGHLVGEVTLFEGGALRIRRLYASAASYAIVDIEGPASTRRGRGGAGNFVVLGNRITKEITERCIRERWKGGNLRDATEIIVRSMEGASRATASVSKTFVLVRTEEKVDLDGLVEGDAGKPEE